MSVWFLPLNRETSPVHTMYPSFLEQLRWYFQRKGHIWDRFLYQFYRCVPRPTRILIFKIDRIVHSNFKLEGNWIIVKIITMNLHINMKTYRYEIFNIDLLVAISWLLLGRASKFSELWISLLASELKVYTHLQCHLTSKASSISINVVFTSMKAFYERNLIWIQLENI